MKWIVLAALVAAAAAAEQPKIQRRSLGKWFDDFTSFFKKGGKGGKGGGSDYDYYEPEPHYGAPVPSYGAPEPSYFPPAPTYGPPPVAPAPNYGPPPKAYGPPPAPVYGPPPKAYGPPPAPVYGPPPKAPAPVYGPPPKAPAPVYGPPPPVYGAPPKAPIHKAPLKAPIKAPVATYGPPPPPSYGPPPAPSYGPPPAPSYGPPPAPSYGAPPVVPHGPPPPVFKASKAAVHHKAPLGAPIGKGHVHKAPLAAPIGVVHHKAPLAAPIHVAPVHHKAPLAAPIHAAPVHHKAPLAAPIHVAPVHHKAPLAAPIGVAPVHHGFGPVKGHDIISDSYSAPSAPIPAPAGPTFIAPQPAPVPVIPVEPTYVAPAPAPLHPLPMADHGSSSDTYFDSSPAVVQIQPSAPPAPLYEVPAVPQPQPLPTIGPIPGNSAPVIAEDLIRSPVEEPIFIVDQSASAGVPLPVINAAPLEAPRSLPHSVGTVPSLYDLSSQLGPDDPIIEIVFQDAPPAPAPRLPSFDPAIFDQPEEPVEVYFIEYAPDQGYGPPGAEFDIRNAIPAVAGGLPADLPADVQRQLLDSGILNDATVEILDLDQALNSNILDPRAAEALAQAYGAESRVSSTKVKPPPGVNLKVHRLLDSEGDVGSLLAGLRNFRSGQFAGVVEVNDDESEKFIPLSVDGQQFPLPEGFEDREIAGVLVLAEDDEDEPAPPSFSADPKDNLVERTGKRLSTRAASDVPLEVADKSWFAGKDDDWVPLFF